MVILFSMGKLVRFGDIGLDLIQVDKVLNRDIIGFWSDSSLQIVDLIHEAGKCRKDIVWLGIGVPFIDFENVSQSIFLCKRVQFIKLSFCPAAVASGLT